MKNASDMGFVKVAALSPTVTVANPEKNAETALDQIKRQHYPASIASYTGDILLVGVNYDKKTKVHECRIEKYLKSGEK